MDENATEGIVVAPGQIDEKNPSSLRGPSGMIVDHMGNIYIADTRNPQITRWSPGAIKGNTVVGEKQYGSGATQLIYPLIYHLIGRVIFMLLIMVTIEYKNLLLIIIEIVLNDKRLMINNSFFSLVKFIFIHKE